MNRTACVVAIIIVFFSPIFLAAQVVNGRFSSAVYTWERFDTVAVSKVLIRGLQTLQLDVIQGDLSLQTYLGGATNFNDPFANESVFRVYNAFLRWKNIGNAVDLNVGRVPVFAGVGNGIVDGGLVRARLLNNDLTLVAYGGVNVRTNVNETNLIDLNDHLFVGGQIAGNLTRDFRLGVSYLKRNAKRDAYTALRSDSLTTFSVLVTPDVRAEQIFGIDARYAGMEKITAYGRYDYDMYSKRSLRTQLSGRVTATEDVSLTLDYIYREPRIFYNSIFTVFPINPVSEYEGGVEYTILTSLRANAKLAYVQYKDDNAKRYTVGVHADYGGLTYSGTSGYVGELNSIDAQAMYPMFDRTLIPTLGISYASYRHVSDGEQQNIFAASLGGVVRPIPAYSIDLQLQWLQNPILSSDVRLFGKINYWFHESFNFFD
jgi:hypothetical protein